jgi:hypothetical protein
MLAMAVSIVITVQARAELIELKILHREPHDGGKAFEPTGPYEKIVAVARFAVDPEHLMNKAITDLNLAPRNLQGKVEFESDVYILAPKDLARGNGALFYDVNNRGNKLALGMFNTPADNPFLMRRGYTVVWCGWDGELLPGGDRLLLKPPVAMENGKPVRGIVRFETVTDKPAKSAPLSRRDNHGSYVPTAEGLEKAVLTQRPHERDPRVTVPRSQWRVVPQPMIAVKEGVAGTLPQVRLELETGFEPGMLYELVCECEGPIVQGTGFAAVRDLISFLRHDQTPKNPFRRADGKPAYDRAFAFGVSQSGRFLRQMLFDGFNQDEHDRIVFDGLVPHVAGGGLGFFNHRFAQPTRHNGQHEEHLYPADVFPFTYGASTDPFTQRNDSILRHYNKREKKPMVMHTQSAAEYWHRSGSLVHTDPLGKQDAPIPWNVRVYGFGGTQHGPAADPPAKGIAQNLANPADYRPFLRALLDALDEWVRTGKEPPPSVYPLIADKTAVDWKPAATGFPRLPGIKHPAVIQQPPFADFGPDFFTRRIITQEPPVVKGEYVVLVPKSDADGNDTGTLNLPDVAVPLATYTGWNLRSKEVGAEGALASLMGSYIPLPRTKADRDQSGDPRRSIEERYGSFETYRKRYAEACETLVRGRYLLAEDAKRLIDGRTKVKPQFP